MKHGLCWRCIWRNENAFQQVQMFEVNSISTSINWHKTKVHLWRNWAQKTALIMLIYNVSRIRGMLALCQQNSRCHRVWCLWFGIFVQSTWKFSGKLRVNQQTLKHDGKRWIHSRESRYWPHFIQKIHLIPHHFGEGSKKVHTNSVVQCQNAPNNSTTKDK